MSIFKPKITGKHSKKQQRTENQISKYKLSGGPIFRLILPGWGKHTPAPVSQWCRSWGCKRTTKSFDLSKIRAKSLKIWAQML